MAKTRAPRVQAELHSFIRDLPASGSSLEDIGKRFAKRYKQLLDEEHADIYESGYLRMISNALRSRKSATPTAQLELFAEYKVGKTFALRFKTKKGVSHRYKDLSGMTVADAEIYIEQHERPRIPDNREVEELKRLVKDVKESGARPSDNLLEAWEAVKKAG